MLSSVAAQPYWPSAHALSARRAGSGRRRSQRTHMPGRVRWAAPTRRICGCFHNSRIAKSPARQGSIPIRLRSGIRPDARRCARWHPRPGRPVSADLIETNSAERAHLPLGARRAVAQIRWWAMLPALEHAEERMLRQRRTGWACPPSAWSGRRPGASEPVADVGDEPGAGSLVPPLGVDAFGPEHGVGAALGVPRRVIEQPGILPHCSGQHTPIPPSARIAARSTVPKDVWRYRSPGGRLWREGDSRTVLLSVPSADHPVFGSVISLDTAGQVARMVADHGAPAQPSPTSSPNARPREENGFGPPRP